MAEHDLSSLSIMIVDDYAPMRTILRSVFKEFRVSRVTEAADGEQAHDGDERGETRKGDGEIGAGCSGANVVRATESETRFSSRTCERPADARRAGHKRMTR